MADIATQPADSKASRPRPAAATEPVGLSLSGMSGRTSAPGPWGVVKMSRIAQTQCDRSNFLVTGCFE